MRDALAEFTMRYLPLRRMDRYVLRQFATSYLICTSALLGLFMVLESVSKLDKFLDQQQSNIVWVILHYFAVQIPVFYCQYLGPVLTLIGAMFALSTINKHREIVPLKASGISVHRTVAPLFLAAAALGFLQFGMQEFMLPNMKQSIRTGLSYGERKSTISPNPIVGPERRLRLDIESYDPVEQRGSGHVVFDEVDPQTGQFIFVVQSETIVWVEEQTVGASTDDGYWELREVVVQEWTPTGKTKYGYEPGQKLATFRLPDELEVRPIDVESTDQEIPYLSYGELLQQFRRQSAPRHIEVKLHQRFAFPLANVILLLLGLPFVLREGRQSIIVGVGLAIAIAAAYLLCATVCADLGNRGQLPPAVAAWLPVLFFGALGFTLFDAVET